MTRTVVHLLLAECKKIQGICNSFWGWEKVKRLSVGRADTHLPRFTCCGLVVSDSMPVIHVS